MRLHTILKNGALFVLLLMAAVPVCAIQQTPPTRVGIMRAMVMRLTGIKRILLNLFLFTKAAQEKASAYWIQKNTKQCPRCAVNIEKDGGCPRIGCTQCHHNFCWYCLSSWDMDRYQCSAHCGNR